MNLFHWVKELVEPLEYQEIIEISHVYYFLHMHSLIIKIITVIIFFFFTKRLVHGLYFKF